MTTISQVKASLTGMLHGGTLNKVRNIEYLFERAGNTMLSHIDPIETERIAALSNLVYDDVYNYSVPSDLKKPIDLLPQESRTHQDSAQRTLPERFDLQKEIANKTISLESSEGTRFLRINWRKRAGKLLHSMNSLTANGTWSAVGSASGLKAQSLYKISGNASIEFDLAASGDGIQNTGMTAVDLTDEDEVADVFAWVYLPSTSTVTSISALWGNDLTTNYWTAVAQTAQADGTAFKTGWNLIRFPWSTATETGTVAPATIDSFRLTVAVSSGTLTNVRVDNIIFTVGRPFDLKYYSQYIFRNSAGTFLRQPTSDDDNVVFEGTALEIYLAECLKEAAQQFEGEDSSFDINFANQKLWGNSGSPDPIGKMGLYAKYRKEYPSASKKVVTSWTNPKNPNLRSR